MFSSSKFRSLAISLSLLVCSLVVPSAAGAQQTIAGVQVFPNNNVWNTKITSRSVDSRSADYINEMVGTRHFHPDWGANPAYGIPFNIVQDGLKPLRLYPVTFLYDDESDVGPYPISNKLKIEGNNWNIRKNPGDRHVLMINPTTKVLYELFYANRKGKYTAGSGAIFHLDSNALRPDGWTSADAAGLPIFPALVHYDEAASGVIKHALRMTAHQTKGYVWPARHFAGPQNDNDCPPLGKRFRLKASFNISSFSSINRAILTAMKEYGLFICDQGSDWYVQGASDPRWNDDDLNALKTLTGNDFEVIDETPMIVNPDSAQANP
jgi:hypothetical protein